MTASSPDHLLRQQTVMFASVPLVFLSRDPSETRTRLPPEACGVRLSESHIWTATETERTGLRAALQMLQQQLDTAADDALCGRLVRLCARTPGWDAGRCS